MINLNFFRDGYVKASEIEQVIGGLVDHIADSVADIRNKQNEKIDRLSAENKELRRRIEHLERLSRAPLARAGNTR